MVRGSYDAAQFSPDGHLLAAWSPGDPWIQVWDVSTGREVRRFDADMKDQPVGSYRKVLAFSPDGRLLASILRQGKLLLWDLRTGKPRTHAEVKSDYPDSLTFSPDGSLVAWSDAQSITLWDITRGTVARTLWVDEHYRYYGVPLAFSPDGRLLVAGTSSLIFWDPAAGTALRRIELEPRAWISALAFSPNGKELAALAGSMSGTATIRRWEVPSGREFPLAGVHCGSINDIAFSPDCMRIASLGTEGSVALWELGHQSKVWSGYGYLGRGLGFDADGGTLGTIDETGKVVCLLNAATGQVKQRLRHSGEVSFLGFPADGKYWRTATEDGTIHEWRSSTENHRDSSLRFPAPLRDEMLRDDMHESRFSHDGRLAIVPLFWTMNDGSPKAVILLADAIRGTRLPSIELPPERHLSCKGVFSLDGRTLAVAQLASSKTFVVYEVATGKERARIAAPGGLDVWNFGFATDGRLLAYAAWSDKVQGAIHVWDIISARELCCFQATNVVTCLAFSPDGQILASGLADTTVLIWDLADVRRSLQSPPQKYSLADLDALWAELAGMDARKAFLAELRLASAPEQTVSLLAGRLHPASPDTEEHINRLISDLDSKSFPVREKASRELQALRDSAEPALRRALRGESSPEKRRRIEQLWSKLNTLTSEQVRVVRSIEVLERLGTPAAVDLLGRLANGSPGVRISREAKAALLRLGPR